MVRKHRFFISGAMIAVVFAAAMFSIGSIYASGSALSEELRFARQIGIYDTVNYSSKMLNRPIAQVAFYRGLASVLHELGYVGSAGVEELYQAGIISASGQSGNISRRSAVEAIFRAVSHGIDSGFIQPSGATQIYQPFYDWIIEEKYMQALGEVLNRGIVKGMPNGRFNPAMNLKTADALVLFKRIHSAFTAVKTHAARETAAMPVAGQGFVRLEKAGAFIGLANRCAIEKQEKISLKNLTDMIYGVLTQAKKPAFITETKYLVRNMNLKKPVSRATLAYLGSIMVRAMPTQQLESAALYADVKADSGLGRALVFLSRAGIRMGYENNLLKGNETVSAHEAMSLLEKILEVSELTRVDNSNAATRNDFEEYKSIIEARKARIRRILGRNTD